jgi:hypothetical protein
MRLTHNGTFMLHTLTRCAAPCTIGLLRPSRAKRAGCTSKSQAHNWEGPLSSRVSFEVGQVPPVLVYAVKSSSPVGVSSGVR